MKTLFGGKNKKKGAMNCFSLGFILVIVGILLTSPAQAQKKVYLHLATSDMGGTWFPLGSGICALINTKVPGATAAPTLGGGAVNIKNIEKQDVHQP